MRVFLALAAALLIVIPVNATPTGSTVSLIAAKTASPQVAENANLTFEKYGPQSRARAVRASLKAALAPDPLSMGALLFCAFALRWMRMRKEQTQRPKGPAPAALPGAA